MKTILRLIVAVLGLVVAAGLAVLAVVAWDANFSGRSAAMFTNVEYPALDGNTTLRGFVVKPAGSGPHPAVIMIHEFWGLNEDIQAKARKLAAEGYLVLAPDGYRNRTTDLLPRAIYLASTTPGAQIDDDMQAALNYLGGQGDVDTRRIAVMGFCFGGGRALRLGLRSSELAATVVFYGNLVTDPAELGQLKGPVLGIFGEQDRAPSPEQARLFQSALLTRGIRNQISIYPGVGHAFLTSENISRPGPAGDAWKELLTFLDANVKRPVGR